MREKVPTWRTQALAAQAQAEQARRDAALVIHALDCSLALVEAMMINLPNGQPVDPGVAAAKGALDNAMAAIRGRKQS